MKKNRHGKAAIFKPDEITRIRKAMGNLTQHRAIFEIALLTGERIGAVIQLKVSDIYLNPATRTLQDKITYQAKTRKDQNTRQVDFHPELASFLRSYQPPSDGYLFPGREVESHITYNGVYLYWKEIFTRCGLDHRGFSCHSTRRWFITQLAKGDTSVKTMKKITGHKNTSVLLGYIDDNEEQQKHAIANIKVAA